MLEFLSRIERQEKQLDKLFPVESDRGLGLFTTMLFKYWAPEIVAELLSLPSVCDRVNQWTAANHGGRVFWHGGTHFNDREYKTCGGGWHMAWRPFGGCGTAWVERWENGVKVDSMKFALSRDYALIDGALRRV